MSSAFVRYLTTNFTAKGTAYTAARAMGTGLRYAPAFSADRGNAYLRSVSILDAGNQTGAIDLLFFASREGMTGCRRHGADHPGRVGHERCVLGCGEFCHG